MDDHEPQSAHSSEIAHVLFMDIVAYSTLPTGQQQRFLEDLNKVVRNTPECSRASTGSQLIRLPTGDGMALVFLRDPEAPVRCALQISEALREHPEIKLRMGIHTGPVYRVADINANLNVAGGGINLAQRVMDCGDPGHILVSKATADVLNEVGGWKGSLKDLGELKVKHGLRLHLFEVLKEEAGRWKHPKKLSLVRARRMRRVLTGALVVVVVAGALGAWLFYSRKVHALTDKDTIVLADFTNKTGDPVFDDTLKQALAVDLAQSPFLNILSGEKIRRTLREMTRSPKENLTQDLAREVCQRSGSTAYLSGSIGAMGTLYVIDLEALLCASGDVLARAQETAAQKEQVLASLGRAATEIRQKVGESLASVHKFDVPLAEATTNSLDALKAFSTSVKISREKGEAACIPYLQRAIELDPHFALALTNLGVVYSNLNQPALGAEYLKRAFDHRDRVTEREKFHITSLYYALGTGEQEKANQAYELWISVYPRDVGPHMNLGSDYMILGEYQKAESKTREALRLDPNNIIGYANLGAILLALNRFDEGRKATEEVLGRNLDGIPLHLNLYGLAFAEGNLGGMKQQAEWAVGKPGAEDQMLSLESDTEAWSGRLAKARELSRQAVGSAVRDDGKEPAGLWQANEAIREALVGNIDAARKLAAAAVALAPQSRDSKAQAALAYSLGGDAPHARSLVDELAKRFPQDTVVQLVWLPTIRAQLENGSNNVARSIDLLQPTAPYELGMLSPSATNSCMYPIYIRAEAYLIARRPEAAAEFQKILDHRGLASNCTTGTLAHLGLARAYILQGETAKARDMYQDFLTLWKDADPDIPILKQAKSEYANLQ